MRMRHWRFLDTGKGSAFFHMALDEAIFDAVRCGESPPTMRLYCWDIPSITLGFSQNANAVLDLDRCERHGIPVTRRLTGGRAVLHVDESTYSLFGAVDDPVFGGALADTYRSVSRMLIDALAGVGLRPEWSRGTLTEENAGVGAAPCFCSASRYEITLEGRKLVGSAQRRMGGHFIQQGSILTGPGHERIVDYQANASDSDRLRKELAKKSVDLSSVMGHPVEREMVCTLLAESLARTAGIEVNHDEPSPRELECAYRLIETRYASKGWVIGHGE